MIRLLKEADAADWRNLRLQGLWTDPSAFGQTYDEASGQSVEAVGLRLRPEALEHVPVFGAFHGSTMVGTVGLVREPRIKLRHKVTLWGMYVAPAARGLAVGKGLLAAAIAHARTMPDVLQIHLSVTTDNAVGKGLYRGAGFKTYGREIRALRHDGIDYDEEHMVLFLDGETPTLV